MASMIAKRIAWAALVLMSAGCGGIGLRITGTPVHTETSQPVDFQINLTNHGLCPADSSLVVLPFVTDQQIIEEGDGEAEAILDLFCKGMVSFEGGVCTIAGDIITCNVPATGAPVGPNASTQNSFLLLPSGLPAPIPCTRTGQTIQCQIPPADRQAFSFQSLRAQTSALAPTTPATCMPLSSDPMSPLGCLVPRLAAGGMTTLDLTLNSPSTPDTYRTLAFVDQTDGVCQDGPTPGRPCNTIESMPCGAGTCQTSICTSGTNTGDGCALDSDCVGGGTGSCQPCVPDFTTTTTAPAPLGCATTSVGAPVPAASYTGLLMVSSALLAFGAFQLLWRQRRTD
jgi:hypothetical protein